MDTTKTTQKEEVGGNFSEAKCFHFFLERLP